MPGLKDRLTDAGYALGWLVVCRLPESWAQRAFRFFADLAWRRQGRGVQVLEGNLRRVIGPEAAGGKLRALSRRAMRPYARYWLQGFRLPGVQASLSAWSVTAMSPAGAWRWSSSARRPA